jgi:hypothetical protein
MTNTIDRTTFTTDETSYAIAQTKRVFSEGKETDFCDPIGKGIPERFVDFAEKFNENIGGTRIIFAHMTKAIYLDRRGRKPYVVKTTIPQPTVYFDTDAYHICMFYENDILELHLMDVMDKGKGLGSKLMNAMLDAADEIGIRVKLIPIAYASSDTPSFVDDCVRLKRFYMSFGFQPNNISPYLTYIP